MPFPTDTRIALPASKKVVSPDKNPRTAPKTSASVRTRGRFMKAAAKADAAEAKKLPTAEKSPLMKSQTPTITSRAQRNGVARKSKTAPPMALRPSSTERSPVSTCQTA